ncbi:VCBS repeat-containing protein [Catalinimonas niigatensis]|uniref:VCBS repeat-containing protein n=1 Tax=Catalinimonas niigatensis TaxID=1397264 RepID=UPI002666EA25|nr:VCBS repeat-containing protein [Catalinimonas niigatensis]WPP48625.1 VCBS repeat-containing protein [Catalinimonas niigatensis]
MKKLLLCKNCQILKFWQFSLFLFVLTACNDTKETETLFTKMASDDIGINFQNILRETEEFNVMKYGYFYNGGGVAVGDINNDSLPDIYLSGNLVASKLYLNKGNWEFEDITEQAGVAAAGLWNTGVSMADVNGDGWLDIYVCRSAAADPAKRKNLLFINNGAAGEENISFSEMGEQYGLADQGYTTQTTFFDYDRDGDLDAFVLNHSTQEYAGFSNVSAQHKNRKNNFLADKLYRNDIPLVPPSGAAVDTGDDKEVKFTDISEEAGIIQNVLGFGLGVSVTDVNQDGWFDIYVTNDYNEEDYLYINQQDGTFAESLRAYINHVSLFSMGSDAADLNNDALPDIITLDMLPEENERVKVSLGPENYDKYQKLISSGFHYQTMRNMLQLNNGNNSFSEIGQLAGISSTDWSWAPLIADYDLDGWKDIFITNGYARNYLDMDFMNYVMNEQVKNQQKNLDVEFMALVENMPSIEATNYLYQNQGDLTFKNQAASWGLEGQTQSNGAVYADLDNDGDLDLIVNNVNEEVSVYKNNSLQLSDPHYLKIRLEGQKKNSFGIGAKVYVYADGKTQYQEMIPVRGFQSSVNYELVFGLGKENTIDSLKVIWPDGKQQKLENLTTDQTLTLDYTAAQPVQEPKAISPVPALFQPTESNLNIAFEHQENIFLDFKRDKMLPYGISNLGPKIAKGDINGDGLEDLYVGGAKGQSGQLYRQLANGTFATLSSPALEADAKYEDTDAVFFDADQDGDLDLYVVSGGSDFAEQDPALQDRLYVNDGKGSFTLAASALPEMLSSGGCVTIADPDNDGDLDLFIGGRLVPGRYPLSPRSYLLQNDGSGKFTDVTQAFAPDLVEGGMISDAHFEDLNGDGFADLVVVGEWMPIRVFHNEEGKRLQEAHMPALARSSGWWNTIHATDFDQDGDTDFVVGNFGKNNLYHVTAEQPARLIYKDFDGNGSIDPIFTHYLQGEEVFAYSKDELLGQIISLKKKFYDYKTFSQTAPKDYFTSEQLNGADTLYAQMLESVYLQNEGGTFKLVPLPIQAQFSPVYAIASLPVNDDAYPELILGGNQSLSRVSTGRYDANYGLVLSNQNGNAWEVMKPAETGMTVRGDVRSIVPMEINENWYLFFGRNKDSLSIYQKINVATNDMQAMQ